MPIDQERYIAAVEVSSSKIVAAVGKISPDGQLEVIAVEQEKGVEAVRYGIIQNLEETSMKIARIINRLEQRPALAHRRITGLYVALSGRSLRSIATEVSMPLPDDTEINEDILRRLRDNALHTPIDSSLEVVDAVPRIYRLGKTDTHSPKGMIANSIRATFDLIVCRPELKRNLMRTISDKLGIKVSGFVVTALATGHLILSDEQKRLGCMLADMGAETTTVTIYKGGYLRYFATLPLGGRNITRDITSLNLLEEKAEETKITSGQAIPNDSPSTLNINGIKTLRRLQPHCGPRRGDCGQCARADRIRRAQGERPASGHHLHRRRLTPQRHARPALGSGQPACEPRTAPPLREGRRRQGVACRDHRGDKRALRRSHPFHRRMPGGAEAPRAPRHRNGGQKPSPAKTSPASLNPSGPENSTPFSAMWATVCRDSSPLPMKTIPTCSNESILLTEEFCAITTKIWKTTHH